GRIPLHEMGFWNLLSDVLSHFAVLRIRDWGSYYHLIGENPNAAEHLVMWLRAIKSSESLRGIRGGMAMLVEQLRARLQTYEDVLTVETDRLLQKLEAGTGDDEGHVVLHLDGRADPVVAREVILAMPKRPLQRLNIAAVKDELEAVLEIPLLKVFFVIDQ